MKKKFKALYLSIEINFVLWLVVSGSVLFSNTMSTDAIKIIALVGLLFAAILQHWAYYMVFVRNIKNIKAKPKILT
jgi:hypothetical protein